MPEFRRNIRHLPFPFPQNTDPRLQPFQAIPGDDKGEGRPRRDSVGGITIYMSCRTGCGIFIIRLFPYHPLPTPREGISSVIAREQSDRGDLTHCSLPGELILQVSAGFTMAKSGLTYYHNTFLREFSLAIALNKGRFRMFRLSPIIVISRVAHNFFKCMTVVIIAGRSTTVCTTSAHGMNTTTGLTIIATRPVTIM